MKKKKSISNELDPWSRFKDIYAKKDCFREQFKKTTSETALFCRHAMKFYILANILQSSISGYLTQQNQSLNQFNLNHKLTAEVLTPQKFLFEKFS